MSRPADPAVNAFDRDELAAAAIARLRSNIRTYESRMDENTRILHASRRRPSAPGLDRVRAGLASLTTAVDQANHLVDVLAAPTLIDPAETHRELLRVRAALRAIVVAAHGPGDWGLYQMLSAGTLEDWAARYAKRQLDDRNPRPAWTGPGGLVVGGTHYSSNYPVSRDHVVAGWPGAVDTFQVGYIWPSGPAPSDLARQTYAHLRASGLGIEDAHAATLDLLTRSPRVPTRVPSPRRAGRGR